MLSQRLPAGNPLRNGEKTISASITNAAEALYILESPKTKPVIADSTGPNSAPAIITGIYAIVTERGGICM